MSAAPPGYENATAFAFGNTPEIADDRAKRVIAGTKTTTCAPLSDYHATGEALPQVGHHIIVLDGQGKPAAAIEITEITVQRYDAIDAQFAIAEGYHDLAEWHTNHTTRYEQSGGFSADMLLVCQWFRVIEVFR